VSDLDKKSVLLRIYLVGNRKWVIGSSSKYVLRKPKACKSDVVLYKFQETKLVIPCCTPQTRSFLLEQYNEPVCNLCGSRTHESVITRTGEGAWSSDRNTVIV
jgi:hypothetical protein